MRPKYKVTGCARFFVFFIIFIPIVFFGASYMRGENGLQTLKEFFQGILGTPKSEGTSTKTLNEQDRIDSLEKELDEAKEKIKELEDELAKEKAKNQ